LDLSQNQIVSITGIGELHGLEQLDLSQNRLDYLPDDMGQLRQLKELRLAKNRLTTRGIPLELFNTPLATLDISENRLKNISLELCRSFSNVPVLLLHGNQWEAIELQKVAQNTPQEEVKQFISLCLDRLGQNTTNVDTLNKSDENLKEKKKTITENVGGFLARKLSIGRGSHPKQEAKQKVDIGNEQSNQVVENVVKQDVKVVKPLVFSRAEGSKQKDNTPPVIAAASPSQIEPEKELSPKSIEMLEPSKLLQEAPPKLPERTAAPLKQQHRVSGPKGRKPPSAEFIAQSIPDVHPQIQVTASTSEQSSRREEDSVMKQKTKIAQGTMPENSPNSGSHSKDTSIDTNISDQPPPQLPPKSTKPLSRSGSQSRRPSTPNGNENKNSIEFTADKVDRDESTKSTAPQLPSKTRKQTDSKQQAPVLIEQQEETPIAKSSIVKPNGPQFDISELKSRQQKHQEEPIGPTRTSSGSSNEKPASTKLKAETEIVPPKVPPKKGQENGAKEKLPEVSKNSEAPLPPRPKRTDSNNQLTDSPKPLRPGAPQFDLSELKSKQEKVEEAKKANSPSSSSPAGQSKLEDAQKAKPETNRSDLSPNRIVSEVSQNPIHAQLKEQLNRQLSNMQSQDETTTPSRLKKSDADKSQDKLNMPKEVPALPPKVAPRPNLESTNSQKNVLAPKEPENSSIPPWKQELERRKQQQQQA
jgi:hypothetical protein